MNKENIILDDDGNPFHVLDKAYKENLTRHSEPIILENGAKLRTALYDWDQICGNNGAKKNFFDDKQEKFFIVLIIRALEGISQLPFDSIVRLTTMKSLWEKSLKIISDFYDKDYDAFCLWVDVNKIGLDNNHNIREYYPFQHLGGFKKLYKNLKRNYQKTHVFIANFVKLEKLQGIGFDIPRMHLFYKEITLDNPIKNPVVKFLLEFDTLQDSMDYFEVDKDWEEEEFSKIRAFIDKYFHGNLKFDKKNDLDMLDNNFYIDEFCNEQLTDLSEHQRIINYAKAIESFSSFVINLNIKNDSWDFILSLPFLELKTFLKILQKFDDSNPHLKGLITTTKNFITHGKWLRKLLLISIEKSTKKYRSIKNA